jgi:HSP20 family protein
MANISIQKHNGDKPTGTAAPAEVWDPWRTMRAILSWHRFRESPQLFTMFGRDEAINPAIDVKETKDAYLFKADVPGIRDTDLEVTMTGNRLTISGKREEEKEEKADRYYTYERNYGTFSRSFTLPAGAEVEDLRASLEQGVLTITVPKKPEVQPKKVEVRSEKQ